MQDLIKQLNELHPNDKRRGKLEKEIKKLRTLALREELGLKAKRVLYSNAVHTKDYSQNITFWHILTNIFAFLLVFSIMVFIGSFFNG